MTDPDYWRKRCSEIDGNALLAEAKDTFHGMADAIGLYLSAAKLRRELYMRGMEMPELYRLAERSIRCAAACADRLADLVAQEAPAPKTHN